VISQWRILAQRSLIKALITRVNVGPVHALCKNATNDLPHEHRNWTAFTMGRSGCFGREQSGERFQSCCSKSDARMLNRCTQFENEFR
jgi:hypothetical protein